MSAFATVLVLLALGTTEGPAPTPQAAVHKEAHKNTKILLVTHPTVSVVKNYATLAKDRLLDVTHLHILGVYGAAETENYAEAQAYITAHHLWWMSLRAVTCTLKPDEVFANNACREEYAAILAGADGMVLNGGADIQPSLYQAPQSMLTQVETPARHLFEVGFLVQALGSARAPAVVPLLAKRHDFPILGICVGMQTLNVAGGGTLVQDIPTQIYKQSTVEDALNADPATWHRNHSHELGARNNTSVGVMHPIHLTPQAPDYFRQTVRGGAQDPLVLSVHHQAVEQVAPGYTVYATSEDGKIVEMMGRSDFPNVLALQFHPERSPMWEKQERALVDPSSHQHNFIYEAMSKDVYTRAFNRSIWQWMSERLLAPAACAASGAAEASPVATPVPATHAPAAQR